MVDDRCNVVHDEMPMDLSTSLAAVRQGPSSSHQELNAEVEEMLRCWELISL